MSLSYSKFLFLKKRYPYLNEIEFAEIFKIKPSTLNSMHYQKRNQIILKKEFELNSDEILIVEDLMYCKNIHPGFSIDYNDFRYLNSLYPNIDKNRFAKILGLSNNQMKNIKKTNVSYPVFKRFVKQYLLKNKDTIIENLITNKHVKYNEKINYERFLELYHDYNYVSEFEFAYYVLDIGFNQFQGMKHYGTSTHILEMDFSLTDAKKAYIFNEILKSFGIVEGQLIDYSLFLKIHREYPFLSVWQLLDVLGISPYSLDKMKYYHKSFYVRNGIEKEKSFYYVREFLRIRFYTIEEIKAILNQYGTSIHYLIVYVLNNGRYFTSHDYIQALEINSGLFIGKTKMSDSFFNAYYDELLKYVKFILGNLKKRNMISYKLMIDDIIQEAMLYIYQMCGDLEINFKNTEECFRKIQFRTQLHLLNMIEDTVNISKKEVYYNDDLNHSVQNESYVVDSGEKMLGNSIYENTIMLMEQGCSFEEAIEKVSDLYKDLSHDEIVENIRKNAARVMKKTIS